MAEHISSFPSKPAKVDSPKTKATTSNPSSPNPVPAAAPKKKTSFQITSVTVGSSRLSNDGGDDSADDLDESHTDDISRITDNETPSFSEDTLSRDEFVSNVIPTSAQYGLAILPEQSQVQPTITSTQTNPVQVNTVNSVSLILEEIVNNSTMSGCFTPLHNINSSPSKGAAQSVSPRSGVQSNPSSINPLERPETPSKEMAETSQPQRSERFKVVKIESTEPFRRGRWMCMDYLDHSVNQPHNSPFIKTVEQQPNGLPGGHQLINPPQTLPVPVQMQNGQNSNIQTNHHPATTINYQPVHQQTNSPVQPQQPSPNPPPPSQQQPPPEYQLQQHIFNQPSPITSQPIQIPGQTYSGPVTSVNNSTPNQAQTYSGQQIQQQFISLPNSSAATTNYPDVIATSTPIATSTISSITLPIATVAETQVSPLPLHRTPSLTNIQVLTQPTATAGAPPQMLVVPLNSPTAGMHLLEQPQQQPVPTNSTAAPDPSIQQGAAAAIQPTTDDESASAASTVAIDNKIEQAMDLVKSHLMFAVREEVEVLKEKIAELMDRINQLEIENTILKSHASPDVLQQLPSPQTQLIYGNVTTIPTSVPNTTTVKTTTTTTAT